MRQLAELRLQQSLEAARGLWTLAQRSWRRVVAWWPFLSETGPQNPRAGYAVAVLGVALVTLLIDVVQQWAHVSNISLVYLLPVLWLAARYGRGPAVFGSLLSFVFFDFFFIPPLFRPTVANPTEWLSLSALLVTSLVAGQLTAAVRARAQEAMESQRRMAMLYAFSQLIASASDRDSLLPALTRRIVEVFGVSGAEACALLLPGERGELDVAAVWPSSGGASDVVSLAQREQASQAVWAFERGTSAGGMASLVNGGQSLSVLCYFVPLRSRGTSVGVLGVAGSEALRPLVVQASGYARDSIASGSEPLAGLFVAFCEQIALALDRAALQQQTVHSEALVESDRLKDALLGSVTHDLRTPLASIKAAASSLLDDTMRWSEADRRDLLESIDVSADRLNRLVSNLLDLSRLEAGVAQPEKDWYSFGDVVAAVLDRLDLTGQLRGRSVDLDLPDDLPLVLIDHAQLEQVLTNLIENALKYSPAESPVRITVEVTSEPHELRVSVHDGGIGIPAHELDAIFGKFYRVQQVRLPWASARPPVGTGLGLAICAAIVQAHGGRIWAESRPGEGSTFNFTLPIPSGGPSESLPDVAPRSVGAPVSALGSP